MCVTAVTEFEEGVAGKKKKKKAGKKKGSGGKADKAAAAAGKKEAEKPKTALSMPEEDEEEVDLVAKMEEARRAMPNACVVSIIVMDIGHRTGVEFDTIPVTE